MHTILGANGIIGEELAKELRTKYTDEIKLVGRNPRKVHQDDSIEKADLLVHDDVHRTLEGCSIAYITVGLPYSSEVWLRDWPIVLQNIVTAARAHQCKLVYFDNTYAYAQDAPLQIETTPFNPGGAKGKGKMLAANIVLEAMASGQVEAVICRAPEFYGPGKTKGFTNTAIFENIREGKEAKVFVSDQTKRTLIYTPDASKAMALIANTPDAYGQTWHLPCDDKRLTYEEIIAEIESQLGKPVPYQVIPMEQLKMGAQSSVFLKETQELFPRYAIDNIFDSSKFQKRFPDFQITSYREGIRSILQDYKILKAHN